MSGKAKPFTLTTAERLVIDRRRRDETQAQAAARHGVSIGRYAAWEAETVIVPADVRADVGRLGQVRPFERCLIMRRRRGWTIPQVARAVGRSPYWVQEMEAGRAPVTDLLSYWLGSA